jgi:hypothetical protein
MEKEEMAVNKISSKGKSLAPRSERQGGKRPKPSAQRRVASDGMSLVPRNEGDCAATDSVPSDPECAALSAYMARRDNKAPMARMRVDSRSGVTNLSFDHASQAIGLALLADVFGTGSSHFVSGLLGQLANASRTGAAITSSELDFMLTVVRGIGPRDETEALLAAQMAAIHNATMSAARRLNHAETTAQQDSTSSAFNKLARTFAAQLEALKRYRSGNEATVKTQNVTVNDGGQAIVGNVQHGGDHENPSRSISSDQPSGAPAPGTALLGDVEEVAPAMPGASGEGQEGLPVPRGTRRRTKRSD